MERNDHQGKSRSANPEKEQVERPVENKYQPDRRDQTIETGGKPRRQDEEKNDHPGKHYAKNARDFKI